MLYCFNTQPPEGGWVTRGDCRKAKPLFQHTAARRRLANKMGMRTLLEWFQHTAARRRLANRFKTILAVSLFQHTAARRRLAAFVARQVELEKVSTHSRPKAAGDSVCRLNLIARVSTHSRPKAAGASLKSLAPSGFAAPISLSSQEKREREYNTAFSVTSAFAIS